MNEGRICLCMTETYQQSRKYSFVEICRQKCDPVLNAFTQRTVFQKQSQEVLDFVGSGLQLYGFMSQRNLNSDCFMLLAVAEEGSLTLNNSMYLV